MNDSMPLAPLALTSLQVQKLCGLSRSCLATLIKRGQLTPLNHIKRNYRLFAYSEILKLLEPPKRNNNNETTQKK